MVDQAVKLRSMSNRERVYALSNDSEKNTDTVTSASSKHVTRTIAITSGKGGVGKSTLCVNLGISLSKMGYKVLLLDGDLGLANLNVLMGIIPDHSIYDVVRRKKRLRDIIISTNYGLDIIAGANGISQLADIGQEERELFLGQLEDLEGYDFLFIDTGAGIGTNVVTLALASNEILLVTTPEPTAITDAYAMIKSIVIHDPKKCIHLLINRAPSAMEAKRVAERLRSISSRFLNTSIESLGFVFEEEAVPKSVRNQRPLVVTYPGSKSAVCVTHIGAQLLNQKNRFRTGGLRHFFQSLMGRSVQDNVGIF